MAGSVRSVLAMLALVGSLTLGACGTAGTAAIGPSGPATMRGAGTTPTATETAAETPTQTPTAASMSISSNTPSVLPGVAARISRRVGYVAVDASAPELDAAALHAERWPTAVEAVRRLEEGTQGKVQLDLVDLGYLNVPGDAKLPKGEANPDLGVRESAIVRHALAMFEDQDVDMWMVSLKIHELGASEHPNTGVAVMELFDEPVAVELNQPVTSAGGPHANLFAHEVGHTLALERGRSELSPYVVGHANGAFCWSLQSATEPVRLPVVMTPEAAAECYINDYGDPSSIMGNIEEIDVDPFTAPALRQLGLLDGKVERLSKAGTYIVDLHTLRHAAQDEVKMVRIDLPPGVPPPLGIQDPETGDIIPIDGDGSWSYIMELSSERRAGAGSLASTSTIKLMLLQQWEGDQPQSTTMAIRLSAPDAADLGLRSSHRGVFYVDERSGMTLRLEQLAATSGADTSTARIRITFAAPKD